MRPHSEIARITLLSVKFTFYLIVAISGRFGQWKWITNDSIIRKRVFHTECHWETLRNRLEEGNGVKLMLRCASHSILPLKWNQYLTAIISKRDGLGVNKPLNFRTQFFYFVCGIKQKISSVTADTVLNLIWKNLWKE